MNNGIHLFDLCLFWTNDSEGVDQLGASLDFLQSTSCFGSELQNTFKHAEFKYILFASGMSVGKIV